MTFRQLKRKINFKKLLLNKLIIFINPTNKFMVNLSVSLDKDVSLYQRCLYKRYRTRNLSRPVAVKNKLIA
ncbi:MAG: hypothetical protein ACRDDY_02825 [Clostridium sp.]|uniref:hypothetical protein n=1 Tax=Clostridium sp. TaxID=1506 RepID=UPI003EE7B4AF